MSTHDEELQKRLQAAIAEKRAKEKRHTVGAPGKRQKLVTRSMKERFALIALIIVGMAFMRVSYSRGFDDDSMIVLAMYFGVLVAFAIYMTRNLWQPKAAHLSKASGDYLRKKSTRKVLLHRLGWIVTIAAGVWLGLTLA